MATVPLPELKSKISVDDQATPVFKNVQAAAKGVDSTFKLLNPTMLAVSVGFGAMASGIAKSVREFAESEIAVKKLNDALNTAGLRNAAYANHLQKVAGELQKTTRFSDEQVLSVQQLLVTYGVYGETLDKATKSILDLAETTDKDAFSAAQALAKAVQGNTDGLRRYGVTIDEAIPKSERFAEALDQIQKKMGGRAEGAADTLVGSFTIVKNSLGELLEKTGEFITKGTGLVRILKDLSVFANQLRIDFGGGTEQENIQNEIAKLYEKQSKATEPWEVQMYGNIIDGKINRLNELKKLEQESVVLAQEQFDKNQQALKLQLEREEAAKRYKKIVEATNAIQDKLNSDMVNGSSNQQRIQTEDAIASRKIEVMREQMKILNTDFERQKADELIANQELSTAMIKKNLTAEELNVVYERAKMTRVEREATDENMKKIQASVRLLEDQRQMQGLGVASSFASGNASGVASGIASMAGSSGPQAAAVGLLVQLVTTSKEIPGKIDAMMTGLLEGMAEGVPALMDYLSGEFISDLMTKFIPGMIEAITKMLPAIMTQMTVVLINVLKNIPNMLAGIAKGIGSGIKDAFKSIGSLFGGGPSKEEKFASVIKELSETIKQLNTTLGDQYRETVRSLSSPATQQKMSAQDFSKLSGSRNNLISQIIEAGQSGDQEKVAELMQQLADTQSQMIAKAEEYYNLELQKIEEVYRKKEDLYKREREEILKRIDDLKSLRTSAIESIQSAREAIISGGLNPTQNVDRLRNAFQSASTPEARSSAAQALASGLQQQFQNAQSLASQGAITGEEFARIQEDILSQLDSTEGEINTQFTELINTQREQIKALDKGFKQVTDAYKKEMSDLRAIMLSIAKQLSKLPSFSGGAVGDPSLTLKKNFKENKYNLKGSL